MVSSAIVLTPSRMVSKPRPLFSSSAVAVAFTFILAERATLRQPTILAATGLQQAHIAASQLCARLPGCRISQAQVVQAPYYHPNCWLCESYYCWMRAAAHLEEATWRIWVCILLLGCERLRCGVTGPWIYGPGAKWKETTTTKEEEGP